MTTEKKWRINILDYKYSQYFEYSIRNINPFDFFLPFSLHSPNPVINDDVKKKRLNFLVKSKKCMYFLGIHTSLVNSFKQYFKLNRQTFDSEKMGKSNRSSKTFLLKYLRNSSMVIW